MLTRRQLIQVAAAGVLGASARAQTVDLERLLAIPGSGRLRAVLDTDTFNEIDDQYAVAYSLLSPERLSVEAIYAAPFVNDRARSAAEGMAKSYEEILRLLSFFDDVDDSIALRGSDRFFERRDRPVESPAARDLIERGLAPGDGPLYVLTIGGPVNVSSAILMEPKIKERIVVVWLGGTPQYWPSASEFNLRQDVIASQVLFDSGVPLVQIPTKNVAEHLRTTVPELDQHMRGRSRLGDYLHGQFLEYSALRMNRRDRNEGFPWSKVIWDISAVAWLNNPAWVPSDLVASPVLTDDMRWEHAAGRHNIRVANNVDRDAVFNDLFSRLAAH
ncbi:MAG: nucleoside hydrolase [Vicinamibacterales bacterium]|jgi:inosine-uridine nucleoside N-ribohydrolase|nr:nucleoside hydrolase [Vicinamibacterales bacterium]